MIIQTSYAYEEAAKKSAAGESVDVFTLLDTERAGLQYLSTEGLSPDMAAGNWFRDRIGGRPLLLIFGCGHVGSAVAQLGKLLEFYVIMVDRRPELTDPSLYPYADEVLCASYADVWEKIPEREQTYVVLTVGDPELCFQIGERALKRQNVYVGMLGSHRKLQKVQERLEEAGVSPEEMQHLYAPVGLPLGGERPIEVALSILAEITRVRNAEKSCELEQDIRTVLCSSGSAAVLAVITNRKGVAPRHVGSRMLVFEDRSICGTIGGGDIEYETIGKAVEMLRSGKKMDRITCVHGNHVGVLEILLLRIEERV